MNEKTLDDLIRKGLDERTPDLEALACLRIAAKQFSDAKPQAPAIDAAAHAKLQEERDNAVRDLQVAKSEAERFRRALTALTAIRKTERKLEADRANVEREVEAMLEPSAAPPARPVKINPFGEWTADMFGGYVPPWATKR